MSTYADGEQETYEHIAITIHVIWPRYTLRESVVLPGRWTVQDACTRDSVRSTTGHVLLLSHAAALRLVASLTAPPEAA